MMIRLSYLTLGNTFWENNSKERKYLHRDICGHFYVKSLAGNRSAVGDSQVDCGLLGP